MKKEIKKEVEEEMKNIPDNIICVVCGRGLEKIAILQGNDSEFPVCFNEMCPRFGFPSLVWLSKVDFENARTKKESD